MLYLTGKVQESAELTMVMTHDNKHAQVTHFLEMRLMQMQTFEVNGITAIIRPFSYA